MAQTVVGWLFIFLGIIGIFLPILQGILFLVIGLMLLAPHYAFAQSLLHKAESKYPDEYAKMMDVQDRLMANKPLMAAGILVLAILLVVGVYYAVAAITALSSET
jgi:uncharacterized protein